MKYRQQIQHKLCLLCYQIKEDDSEFPLDDVQEYVFLVYMHGLHISLQ